MSDETGGPPARPVDLPSVDPLTPGSGAALAATPSRPSWYWAAWPFWNFEERRVRMVVRLLLAVLVGTAAGAALSALGWKPAGLLTNPVSSGLRRLVLSAIVVCAATFAFDRRPWGVLGMRPDRAWWADLAFGLALGAVLMTEVFGIAYAFDWVHVRATKVSTAGIPFGVGLVGAFVVFAWAALDEELIARAYLLRNFADGARIGPIRDGAAFWIAITLSSILFSLGHWRNPNASKASIAGIVLAGVLLALPYVYTGRLAISWGLHLTWNFFQGTIYGFAVSGLDTPVHLLDLDIHGPELWTGGAFGPEAGLLGVLASLTGIAAIVLWVRWREGRLQTSAVLLHPANH